MLRWFCFGSVRVVDSLPAEVGRLLLQALCPSSLGALLFLFFSNSFGTEFVNWGRGRSTKQLKLRKGSLEALPAAQRRLKEDGMRNPANV